MARVPIYTSKAPLKRTPMVVPQPDIAVSEAIGGLAETTGKIAVDWNTAKSQDIAQRELTSATLNYKSKISDYVNSVENDPNYDPEWKDKFNKYEQEIRGGIEFTTQEAKTVAERNFGNYKLTAENNLAGIDRHKYISAGKIQLNTDLDLAVKMRDKGEVKRLIESANLLLSGPAREAEGITRNHDIDVGNIKKLLALDPKADLSEFPDVPQEEKNKLITQAMSVKHNKEVLYEREIGEQQLNNGTNLFTKSDASLITQAELDELLSNREISEETASLLVKPQKADAKTVTEVWNKFADKVSKVGNKYKDRVGLMNEIIKSNRIDGELDSKNAQELINAITNPPSKSKMNDFKVATDYFKKLDYLDDTQRNDLLYILDGEMRENPELKGQAVLDRAREMSKQIEVLDVDLNPAKFINFFIPKSMEEKPAGGIEFARSEWVKEQMKERKLEKSTLKEVVTKKKEKTVKEIKYTEEEEQTILDNMNRYKKSREEIITALKAKGLL